MNFADESRDAVASLYPTAEQASIPLRHRGRRFVRALKRSAAFAPLQRTKEQCAKAFYRFSTSNIEAG